MLQCSPLSLLPSGLSLLAKFLWPVQPLKFGTFFSDNFLAFVQ